jgi:hypothetical protein
VSVPQFVLLVVGALAVWWWFRGRGAPRAARCGMEKCIGCRFNRRSDGDGTLCALDGKEVFKNRIQVSWCQNWEQR